MHQIRHRLNEYFNERQQNGISGRTLNKTLELLKRMLSYGVETNLIPFNPLAGVAKVKEKKKPRRPLTPEEIPLLLEHSDKWRIVWLTFILTGLRKMELVRLQVRDIDRKACTLAVRASKTDAGVRVIHLHRTLQRGLRPLLKGKAPEDSVFTTERGTPLKNNLLRAFRVCLKNAGIPGEGLDLHALRYTFSSLLGSVDVHEKKQQTLMGHRSSVMTSKYTHTYDKDLREAVERISLDIE